MIAVYKGYKGEVVIHRGMKLFYTLDPAAEGHLWQNYDSDILKKGIPIDAYCWWLNSEEDLAAVTYYDGRRRLI